LIKLGRLKYSYWEALPQPKWQTSLSQCNDTVAKHHVMTPRGGVSKGWRGSWRPGPAVTPLGYNGVGFFFLGPSIVEFVAVKIVKNCENDFIIWQFKTISIIPVPSFWTQHPQHSDVTEVSAVSPFFPKTLFSLLSFTAFTPSLPSGSPCQYSETDQVPLKLPVPHCTRGAYFPAAGSRPPNLLSKKKKKQQRWGLIPRPANRCDGYFLSLTSPLPPPVSAGDRRCVCVCGGGDCGLWIRILQSASMAARLNSGIWRQTRKTPSDQMKQKGCGCKNRPFTIFYLNVFVQVRNKTVKYIIDESIHRVDIDNISQYRVWVSTYLGWNKV